jgi:N-acetylglucosaminyldiphosphoundecaprenol N-acetyl-beta-D-mannosaminyltransferase
VIQNGLLRGFDLALALGLLVGLSPLLAGRVLWAAAKAGAVFASEQRVGRFGVLFQRLRFAGTAPGAGLAVLLNIVKGDMAFAGPRPLTQAEAKHLPAGQAPRFSLRPGLFSLHILRRKLGIAYEGEAKDDLDFYYGETVAGNLGLIVRSLIGGLLAGGKSGPAPAVLHILGLDIANTTMDEALDWIVAKVQAKNPALLAFVNPDCLNIAYGHERYRQVLSEADRVLPDGIGVKLACRVQGVSLVANVNGTDLFPRLCERANREGLKLFLLGAKPGIAEAVAENMGLRYPGLQVAGYRDGYFKPEETDAVLAEINASGADILLVAFGAPKQELWLAEHGGRLAPFVRLGVGGLFDFYSGRIPRAPQWVREIGMEWGWRLAQEPGRMWRRYLVGIPVFLYRVSRQQQRQQEHLP